MSNEHLHMGIIIYVHARECVCVCVNSVDGRCEMKPLASVAAVVPF